MLITTAFLRYCPNIIVNFNFGYVLIENTYYPAIIFDILLAQVAADLWLAVHISNKAVLKFLRIYF